MLLLLLLLLPLFCFFSLYASLCPCVQGSELTAAVITCQRWVSLASLSMTYITTRAQTKVSYFRCGASTRGHIISEQRYIYSACSGVSSASLSLQTSSCVRLRRLPATQEPSRLRRQTRKPSDSKK